MVNANEWLDKKIPADEREKSTALCVYRQICKCSNYHDNRYTHPTDEDQSNPGTAPQYHFYNVILEEELNLNDFVNLNELRIEGTGQDNDKVQKLTSLKVDNCTKLTKITINNTTLGYLSLGSKPKLQSANFAGNKWLNFCDNVLKNQVGKLTSLILTKDNSDIKLEAKKLESLVDSQKDILRNNSAYARKTIEITELEIQSNKLNKLTLKD
ncbi:4448_t:CDS:2 [Dentiscutata erythropus]|uniref:4448_t:CDS:1 n=1 Tax=Dentiscutata erythropus TaxID=1348616 RepID=A0A9N9NAB7_9GLOM|nr:4448_t:CDS:2 [Dentiscutata erythropus]